MHRRIEKAYARRRILDRSNGCIGSSNVVKETLVIFPKVFL
jgi:hypothetical protein